MIRLCAFSLFTMFVSAVMCFAWRQMGPHKINAISTKAVYFWCILFAHAFAFHCWTVMIFNCDVRYHCCGVDSQSLPRHLRITIYQKCVPIHTPICTHSGSWWARSDLDSLVDASSIAPLRRRTSVLCPNQLQQHLLATSGASKGGKLSSKSAENQQCHVVFTLMRNGSSLAQ